MDKELLQVLTYSLLNDDQETAQVAFHDALTAHFQQLAQTAKPPYNPPVSETVVIDPRQEGERKEMMAHGKSFESQAKEVWATSDIEHKKKILASMVANFKYKGKAQQFLNKINGATDPKVLDKLAADLHLAQQGMAVGR